MMKRLFDFTASLIGLILLSPIFIILSLLVKIYSEGSIFLFKKE